MVFNVFRGKMLYRQSEIILFMLSREINCKTDKHSYRAETNGKINMESKIFSKVMKDLITNNKIIIDLDNQLICK